MFKWIGKIIKKAHIVFNQSIHSFTHTFFVFTELVPLQYALD